MSINIGEVLLNLWNGSGFAAIFGGDWQSLAMIAIGCVLLYFGIAKKFEPLLLCGIAFGCILTNLPGGNLYHSDLWPAWPRGQPRDLSPYASGGLTPFSPPSELQEIPVATREQSGVLCFHSR